ncbi:helix-turn-helix domain-containing protein [Streptomyces sp. BBFR2]|uniref:helix-turn-helix domain-containing protein n=1 Tax=Streptomyces sp. BBFR2 TaxID=3372854 RepID=UPI0037D9FDAE
MAKSKVSPEPEITDSLKAFGAVVKVFRERAGLTQAAFAQLVQFSPETIASIEQGRRLPPPDFIERAEKALDAFGAIKAAGEYLVRPPGVPSWFKRWAHLEKQARSLYIYECRVIPGLVQTEGYMRTLFVSTPPIPDQELVEQRVSYRLGRQEILYRKPSVTLSFIIEQAVIERQTGGAEVTRDLIDFLLECGALDNVDLQVMPLRQPDHAGLNGSLQVLETTDHRNFAYNEGNKHNQIFTHAKEVSIMQQCYSKMRSQALTPEDSATLLKRIQGAL